MLSPSERAHFQELLRPSPGFKLDCAVGTTYSLDPLALLAAPLAFAWFATEQDPNKADPLTLLDALQRYSRRIHFFCQAGQIKVPTAFHHPAFFVHLEDSVHQVRPDTGVFHPKLWVLRYVDDQGMPEYRLLCATRNLTFDNCWDAALRLDSQPTPRGGRVRENAPLVRFLEGLSELPGDTLRKQASHDLSLLREGVERVRFEAPKPFESVQFHPLGPDSPWPFPTNAERFLIVSPFLAQGALQRLLAISPSVTLLSNSSELDKLSQRSLQGFGNRVYAFSLASSPDEEGEAEPNALTGLHAKLYLAEGEETRLWMGSANATSAGLGQNIEFLVELRGDPGKAAGIEDFLTGLGHFAPPYAGRTEGEGGRDAVSERLQEILDEARNFLLDAGLCAVAQATPEGFQLTVRPPGRKRVHFSDGVEIFCWPITLAQRDVPLRPDGALFAQISREALTPFIAFEARASEGDVAERIRFVLMLPLSGAPENRQEMLLASLLDSREKVLRYLLMLLLGDEEPTVGPGAELKRLLAGEVGNAQRILNLPLLEVLLRTLDRDPRRLRDVESSVQRLRDSGRAEYLPEGFEEVWKTIWEVCQALP